MTLRLYADPAHPDCDDLRTAANILREGGTVAFATETVYGLGANALDPAAVARIFVAKQRPSWDPLIVHVADVSALAEVAATLPKAAQLLMKAYWPGPLTLLVPRLASLPPTVTAGRPAVGVRVPAHPVARALIRAAGVPVAAPSANTFGHVSPTSAAHVAADLDGRIDAILDSGETRHGLESTVLDTTVDPCLLYRPGAITLEQLRRVWPAVERYAEAAPDAPEAREEELIALPSPGVGMRHYAPRARLLLVEGTVDGSLAAALMRAVLEARAVGCSTGLMLPDLSPHDPGLETAARAAGATVLYAWGRWGDADELARRLFAGLRALDDQGIDVIVCPVPSADGIGTAMIDRLRKAARRR